MIIWNDGSTTLFRSVLYETISSVVKTDDCVLIVDPSWLPNEIEEIVMYVDSIRGNLPLYLLFTHSDYDHIIGYNAFPEAKVIASQQFTSKSRKEKEDIIEQIKAFDDDYYISRPYKITYPNVDISIKDDECILEIGGTRCVFFQAPGHNNDGIFTIIEPIGVFLAGDYFSDIEFPYIYFNSSEYEKSILKLDTILSDYPINLLVTGHGNPTSDQLEMKRRQQDSLKYIRNLRELILAKDEVGINHLIDGCRFPRNMKKFHHENYLLLKKELFILEG